MAILLIAAIIGVFAGIYVPQRLLAAPTAIIAGMTLHGVFLTIYAFVPAAAPGHGLHTLLTLFAGPSVLDLIPTGVAAASGAIAAAVLWSTYARRSTNEFWMPTEGWDRIRGRDGRKLRLPIEDRPIHAKAKAFLDEQMGR